MYEYLVAAVIGIVQGVTEFLPISSTGHMIIVGNLMGFTGDVADLFDVFIQLGSILAVLIMYKDKFAEMLTAKKIKTIEGLTGWHVAVGILPVMLVGFLCHKWIKGYLFSPKTVVVGLVVGAVIMMIAEKFNQHPAVSDVEKITLKQAFFVGLFQILSLWPGFSRSGSTISGGLFFGLNRVVAAEFSFIIAVPLMFAACLYDFMKMFHHLQGKDFGILAVGFIVAFIVSYWAIVWFLKFLNRSTLASFAYYRIVLGILVYAYFC